MSRIWTLPSLQHSSSCWSSTWFSRSHSSHLTVCFLARRSRFGIALALATITMQVGVVYTSISAYPLLSAYFLTTYAYKRMRLITRVYGNNSCLDCTMHNWGFLLLLAWIWILPVASYMPSSPFNRSWQYIPAECFVPRIFSVVVAHRGIEFWMYTVCLEHPLGAHPVHNCSCFQSQPNTCNVKWTLSTMPVKIITDHCNQRKSV